MKKICKIIYYSSVFLLFVFLLGNMLNMIPFYGEMAVIYGGSLIHIWVVLAIILGICAILGLMKCRNKFNIAIGIIAIANIAFCGVMIFRICNSLKQANIDVNFIRSYYTDNVLDVKNIREYYEDKNKKKMPINIYTTGDEDEHKPFIIYIHGGGWISNTLDDNEYTSKILAKNGYYVASLEYDLSINGKHLWDTVEEQIEYGVHYLQEKYQLENIYVIGDSAGGNIALNVAYKINFGLYNEVDSKKLPKVKAVSVNYPVADPVLFYNNNNNLTKAMAKEMAVSYTGGSPEEYPNRYYAISPINFAGENTPPTCIILGKNDTLVPPQGTYEFEKQLRNNGVKSKLVAVPYFIHAGDGFKNNLFNQAYIDLTLKWFKENN